MREVDWDGCLMEKSARIVSPDINRAKSLIETSKQRINLIKEITAENCNFVFEDYYISLLELLQAIAFRNGFNVLNHICLGFYLRDILKRKDLYILFDDIRYKRNSLTYYGNRMEFAVAKDAIEKCKRIIKEI